MIEIVRGWDEAEQGPRPYSYDWWLIRDIRWYLREIARKNKLAVRGKE